MQLTALRAAASGDAKAPVNLLAQAAQKVHVINAWCKHQLGEAAPSLEALIRLLDLFATPEPARDVAAPIPLAHEASQSPAVSTPGYYMPSPAVPSHPGARAATRDEVLASIRSAREWFEIHEPSSPVAVLLKQAERMVGKRFSQVADSIPLDLLQKWESEQEAGPGGAGA